MFYGAAFDEFNREWQGIALEEQTEPTSHKEEQEIHQIIRRCPYRSVSDSFRRQQRTRHRSLKHIRTGWDMMRLR